MQLSKQEFNKLSKTEQQRLSKIKNPQKGKGRSPAKGTPSRSNLGTNTKGAPMSKAPVANSRTVKTARPMMVTLRNGDCTVTHREYIGEVTASVSGPPSIYNATSYPLNPGMPQVFPWLSKIAQNFESYNFSKLRFCYETEAPSSLGGTLVLAVDYDALDATPANKQQALAYRGSVRSAPWNDCAHHSLSEDLHKLKSRFVRVGSIPAQADLKTYDVGNLFAITQGVTTSGAVCGELYVEYSVHLMTPVFDSNPAYISGGLITSGGNVTTNNPLGDAASVDAQSVGISVTTGVDPALVSLLNPGTYVITTLFTGVALTATAPATISGVTVLPLSTIIVDAAGINASRTYQVTSSNPTGGSLRFTVSGTSVASARYYVSSAPGASLN